MNKKLIKEQAKVQYQNDKLADQKRKAEIKTMNQSDAALAKAETKQARKSAKVARKQELKDMKIDDRKAAKYFDKKYKKQKTKMRRYISWGALALLCLMVFSKISPILSEVGEIANSTYTDNTPEADAARAASKIVAEQITDEGLVLLKNQDDVLPLTGEKKLNVFGFGAMNYKMGGGGSGASNLDQAVSLHDGLVDAGIAVNPELNQFYEDNSDLVTASSSSIWIQMLDGILGKEEVSEPESIDYLTEDVLTQAKEYSDTALIVVTAMSSEASDATVESLQISDGERELVEMVSNEFENVIILVNSGYAMDLSFVDEYDSIKSVLWIGNPGAYGATSIGKTLTGEVNPSGRLNDTYVYDISSIPAVQNIGDYDYQNLEGISRLDYEEGIYVGYRYYETLYDGDESGYKSAVQYPFGYGLSYSSFDQKITSSKIEGGNVNLSIQVTNTGKVAGKEVVQVYFNPPYIDGGIEKSATELAQFAKTDVLEPGQSQTVNISFPIKDMSSWDMKDAQAYVLDEGDYEIVVGQNAHDSFDSFTWTNKQKVIYPTDEVTGASYHNLFDYANGDLTYLSRADFAGTFPSGDDVELTAPQDVVDAFNAQPTEIAGIEAVTGQDNGLVLADLEGLAFDDPKWDQFLDQFTIEEMIGLISYGGYHTREIERLGVPRTELLDGPAGWNKMFGASPNAASYPTELLLASTWNSQLAYDFGDAIGLEGKVYGIDMWYAPAMNIHRSPIGGRNFEYFSEDPVISGEMAAGMINGAQEHDVMVTIKHFALNEQEVNARSGLIIWANEQAMRELYLRPFEISVKESDPTGAMSSFINIGPVWAGANDELLNKLLREEWGFDGIVSTDAQLGSWMDPVKAVLVGNELMLSIFKGSSNETMLTEAYQEMPVAMSNGLRDRTHTIMYNIVNHSNAVERNNQEIEKTNDDVEEKNQEIE
ncbi:glycoside hydrolase family 3 C-terminal domain-containing protein [Mollicutes bacterium LVI A0039]|nr:glycoside hydrolase family 3 C-terminal domain-containing protein [Mollicutes bacterium LVI A0039]